MFNLTLETLETTLTIEFLLDQFSTLQTLEAKKQDCTITSQVDKFSWTNELALASYNPNSLEIEELEDESLEVFEVRFYQNLGFDMKLELEAL